jgi:mRNA interferase HigB
MRTKLYCALHDPDPPRPSRLSRPAGQPDDRAGGAARGSGSQNTDARGWIENWLADVESAAWTTPQDIRRRYASASFLPEGVVIFNVKGNAYRLEVTVAYRTGVVVIDWIGTHRQYDERNKRR